MKLYPDSKVYISCPGNLKTGGPESLYQLASTLLSLGVPTYMIYGASIMAQFNPQDPVHDAYKKYHVPYVTSVENNPKNIVIITEAIIVQDENKLRRVIWWMSVNNYIKKIWMEFFPLLENPLAAPLSKIFNAFEVYHEDKNVEHWFKSEYARQFLELNGVPADKLRYVEAYANRLFLSRAAQIDLSAKKNIVAFNPRKDFEIIQKLIKLTPDIDWRPIENMTTEQVQELLASAKIYIDLGEHPGKDRLPREAILSGCMVITGRRGAAGNDVDYNLPAEFKFDERENTPRDILEKIRAVFENFEQAHAAQKSFRERELNAQKDFIAQVIDAFEIKNFPPPTVAFTQGFGEKSFLLAQKFSGRKDFVPRFIVDDEAASEKFYDELVWRDCNRNFLLGEEPLLEIITRDDAKFLYQEGRIKKFALLEPTADELDALKNFYGADDSELLLFDEKNEPVL